jgi:hypothetical protein
MPFAGGGWVSTLLMARAEEDVCQRSVASVGGGIRQGDPPQVAEQPHRAEAPNKLQELP